MDPIEFNKISEIKRYLSETLCGDLDSKLPKSFCFVQEIGKPKYKITVELLEEDFFIDSKGRKWFREKDE